jgi:phytoene dehydrogenase-like protein
LRRYIYGPATLKVDWALDGPIRWTNPDVRHAGTVHVAGAEQELVSVEAQIERFAPGFRDLILARHVLAPADLQARNANLVDGDVGGGSYTLRQAVFRPIPTLSPYRTPLPGLYLGSAATFPGGAVHGVPGDAAARAALRHTRT